MAKFLREVSGPPILDRPSSTWIFDRIQEWATRLPMRPAFVLDRQDGIEEFRYPDVLDYAGHIAAGLASCGIHPGDRVGILMENIPQWAFVLLGSMRFGAIAVPLATALPEAQACLLARHAGCKVLFTDAPNLEKAATIATELGLRVVALGGSDPRAISWEDFCNQQRPAGEWTPSGIDTTVLLMYTSGTTGDPKAVQLTMMNLILEIRGIVEGLGISSGQRILSVLPFSHVLPLVANALGPLCIGATVVFLSSISPQRIIEAFKRHRITCFVCVPQFFYLLHKRIFSHVSQQPWIAQKIFNIMRAFARRAGSSGIRRRIFSRIHRTVGPDLRLFASGGSSFDPRIARDLCDLGYTALNAYGLTETSAAVTATSVKKNRIGTVGRPIRGVSIRIDSPNALGIGEICVRGPLLMKGYYNNDAATSAAILNGWLHTGDLGWIDSEGNLTVTGRSKDVIVLANGKNIYPEELETFYERSPLIREVCVLGVRSKDAPEGETLHAIVVPDSDEFRSRGHAAIAELIRYEIENLSSELPSYQRVLSWSIRNEPLPRTVTRKLKRFEIQAEFTSVKPPAPSALEPDDVRFRSGSGAAVASIIRELNPNSPALAPAQHLELDLKLDSLARVELFTEIEARLGAHFDDSESAGIFTLGELLDAVESRSGDVRAGAAGWKEILSQPSSEDLSRFFILRSKPVANTIIIVLARALKLLSRILVDLRYRGLENLPASSSFLLCPNHASFLDAPMLYAVLPSRFLRQIFSLGYSDYWNGPVSRRIAQACNIVAIDQTTNLVRAMKIAAFGIKSGKILLIFPEGLRTIDGHLQEFKRGAAILAYELEVPIVPVRIRGSFEAWPRGGRIKLHPIEIAFGPPIDPHCFQNSPDPYGAITNCLVDAVRKLDRDAR